MTRRPWENEYRRRRRSAVLRALVVGVAVGVVIFVLLTLTARSAGDAVPSPMTPATADTAVPFVEGAP